MTNTMYEFENQANEDFRHFPIIRIAAGLLLLFSLLTLFVLPYFGFPDFADGALSVEDNFHAKTFLVFTSIFLSALVIWAHKRWENVITQIAVMISFSAVVGSLLLYFYYPTQILGLLFVSAWAGALIILPIIIIIALAVAVVLALLISLWILPIYRYFADDKIISLWLAVILALIATPLLAQFMEAGFVVKQSTQYQNYESEINTKSYRVDDNSDLFSVEYTGRENSRYDFYGGYSQPERQTPRDKALTFKPEPAEVSGTFLVTYNSDTDNNHVSFKDESGQVLYESPSVCAFDFNSPEVFSPDKTKYASQLDVNRLCQDLLVYDAASKEKTVIPGPYRVIRWLDNQHILISNTDSGNLEFYSTETKEISPATVPYERFSGGQYNPISTEELNADLHPDRLWLAVANTSPFTKSCELLLLNPKEKRQIVLTDLPLEKTCDGVRWQDKNTLLLHEQGEGTLNRSGGKIYRLQFLLPDDLFSPSSSD